MPSTVSGPEAGECSGGFVVMEVLGRTLFQKERVVAWVKKRKSAQGLSKKEKEVTDKCENSFNEMVGRGVIAPIYLVGPDERNLIR